eukprot:evm.model.scf_431.2 EVM.evm.TU.scf_431.2   scf_431:19805-21680(+)
MTQEQVEQHECPDTGADVWVWPQGCRTWVADTLERVEKGLAELKKSMKDRVVAIDLEWKARDPDSLVALMQLATSTFCLLVRTCQFNFELPQCIRTFLIDPSITLLGFGWDSSDDDKLALSFNMVKGNFGRFLDLQTAIRELAYPTIGIAALTEAVMGTAPKKSKKVTMSNWEKYMLNPYQILYGSWDVFMCGLVLRQLRHWHAVVLGFKAFPTPKWKMWIIDIAR